MMRPPRILLLLVFLSTSANLAFADTVTMRDCTYADVYVTESPRAYYVCLPSEGRALSVAKSDPGLVRVSFAENSAARRALYAEYQARRVQRERVAPTKNTGAVPIDMELRFEMGSPGGAPASGFARKSEVPELRLKGEPGAAIRQFQNVPGSSAGQAAARQSSIGGGGGTGGGGGGGGFSGGGGGGLAGGGGTGGGGFTGGAGQGGGGGGAGGGGAGRGGTGGGTGVGFTNISNLFSTISDAAVGESPNPITGR